MQQDLKFFIAGTIQGSREGTLGIDQGYRSVLQNVIYKSYPNAIIYCPLELLKRRFAGRIDEAVAAYERETAITSFECDHYSALVSEIRSAFVELTNLAAHADVLVAYLPGHEASMGTAMEMWSAYCHKKVVISISAMSRNMAIVATSALILPSVESFEDFLATGRLPDLIDKRRNPPLSFSSSVSEG